MGGGEQSNSATYFVVLKTGMKGKGRSIRLLPLSTVLMGKRIWKSRLARHLLWYLRLFPVWVPPVVCNFKLEDRRNLGPTEMQQAINSLLASYHSKPALASVSSQYQANVPQYFLNIDRDKVQFMGIALNDVFSTLSYYMGAAYVNDFVEFGHIYQVKIEARDQAQRVIDDVLN